MISDQTIYSGTDGKWIDSLPNYPACEYDLVVILKNGMNPAVELTAVADNEDPDSFLISYNADQLQAGENEYQYEFTSKADGKKTISYDGIITVKASLRSSTDTRSEDKKVYDELVAARLRVAQREYVSITINGKATQFKSMDQIDAEIVRYKKKLGLYKTPRIINSFG